MTKDAKHMELISGAITRMAGYSFVAKGWSVSLAAALIAVAAKDELALIPAVGIFAVLIFWLIDGYYLALEKGFRDLFDKAAIEYSADRAPSFQMDPDISFGAILAAMVRPAVALVHLPILLVLLWVSCQLSS